MITIPPTKSYSLNTLGQEARLINTSFFVSTYITRDFKQGLVKDKVISYPQVGKKSPIFVKSETVPIRITRSIAISQG